MFISYYFICYIKQLNVSRTRSFCYCEIDFINCTGTGNISCSTLDLESVADLLCGLFTSGFSLRLKESSCINQYACCNRGYEDHRDEHDQCSNPDLTSVIVYIHCLVTVCEFTLQTYVVERIVTN